MKVILLSMAVIAAIADSAFGGLPRTAGPLDVAFWACIIGLLVIDRIDKKFAALSPKGIDHDQ